MNQLEPTAATTDADPTDFNSGRKGLTYGWQPLFARAAASTLDDELAALIETPFAATGALEVG